MNHNLKIDDIYLKQKLEGNKLFEIRHNDRGYQKGDTVTYTQIRGSNGIIKHRFRIIYVTSYGQPANQVVFGEEFIDSKSNKENENERK